jgi:hypothetical protein
MSMDHGLVIQKLQRLKAAFEAGQIPVLHEHEVNPGLPRDSRENYLYFVMTCALNFQRASPATWRSALATWEDAETNFVFFPEKVVLAPVEVLRAALLRHKLALQPNKHIEIWSKIANTWHQHFKDDPRELFARGESDAVRVLQIVQTEMKKDFPYLSGPKLSNYFIFILLAYSDLKLKNTSQISIIPDTHIMQATQELGILENSMINPLNVEAAWRELLATTEYSPIDFHSILWNWSRNKFQPAV